MVIEVETSDNMGRVVSEECMKVVNDVYYSPMGASTYQEAYAILLYDKVLLMGKVILFIPTLCFLEQALVPGRKEAITLDVGEKRKALSQWSLLSSNDDPVVGEKTLIDSDELIFASLSLCIVGPKG